MTNDYCSMRGISGSVRNAMLPVAMAITVGASMNTAQQLCPVQFDTDKPISFVADDNWRVSVATIDYLGGKYRVRSSSRFDDGILDNYKMSFPEENVLVRVVSDDEYVVNIKAIAEELEGII